MNNDAVIIFVVYLIDRLLNRLEIAAAIGSHYYYICGSCPLRGDIHAEQFKEQGDQSSCLKSPSALF